MNYKQYIYLIEIVMLKKKLYKKYMVILKIKYYENLKIKVLNNNY
jgi:hypothetical protein